MGLRGRVVRTSARVRILCCHFCMQHSSLPMFSNFWLNICGVNLHNTKLQCVPFSTALYYQHSWRGKHVIYHINRANEQLLKSPPPDFTCLKYIDIYERKGQGDRQFPDSK